MSEYIQILVILIILINFFGLIVFFYWTMEINARVKTLELKEWLDTVELGERMTDLSYKKRTIN